MTVSWTARMLGTAGLPAGLLPTQKIEYRLLGDPHAYHAKAGDLNWRDGPGCIADYRLLVPAAVDAKAHSHYFKDVVNLTQVDVYRVLVLFSVTDPALAHAVKKLLVAGGRGAGKDITRDVQEAIDSLQRWQEMQVEDARLKRA